ncbi:hypothetical protein [Paraburkholderia humisilvae]|uniref:Uncharacterized protein n=1 Tax=Paraburkholderia humisilvae TaxID=627669 RepID=A0A6J5DIG6_9BURK|nr:hypothetical protein [Paraburkholderia humisilvae]CAB3753723.1 hypothetical protein LMG29542_02127 [Paraburkholderia humisilvae]
MAGYPDDVRRFEQDKQRDLGMLAQLPSDDAAAYRDGINVNADNVGSTSNAWLRGLYEHDEEALHDEINSAHLEAETDPRAQVQAVFNAPFGSEKLLAADEQQNLAELRALRSQFGAARTIAERDKIFSNACRIKQTLQDRITGLALDEIATQKKAEAANENDVMQAFEDAKGLTGPGATTGARLAYFANRICADPGHARAFTEFRSLTPERLQQLKVDDPQRYRQLTALAPERLAQLTQWENDLAAQDSEAAGRLPEVALDPPKNFSDVRFYTPAPGPDYDRNLRKLYADARDSIVAAEQRISISHERPSSPVRRNYIKQHQPAE